jgi:hypothetical protein
MSWKAAPSSLISIMMVILQLGVRDKVWKERQMSSLIYTRRPSLSVILYLQNRLSMRSKRLNAYSCLIRRGESKTN